MQSNLRVPYAVAETGELVSPEQANKTRSHFCPECNSNLILRRGTVRVPHFAHPKTGNCTNESVTHKIAKMLLAQAINQWKKGFGDTPMIGRMCVSCGCSILQPLPNKITHTESAYTTDTGFRVDVAIMENEEPIAALEVKFTHAVGDQKMQNLGIPIIELNADEIIENNLIWHPILETLREAKCKPCKVGYAMQAPKIDWATTTQNRVPKLSKPPKKRKTKKEYTPRSIAELSSLHTRLLERILRYKKVDSLSKLSFVAQNPSVFNHFDNIEMLIKVSIFLKFVHSKPAGFRFSLNGSIIPFLREWGLEYSGNIATKFLQSLEGGFKIKRARNGFIVM